MNVEAIDLQVVGNGVNASGAAERGGGSTLFDTDPWRAALEMTFGVEIQTFVPPSEPCGRARYCFISDIRGSRIVCLPFSDFTAPRLSESGWSEFLTHLRSFGVPVTVRPFRAEAIGDDHGYERIEEHIWHGIDLTQGFDEFWAGLKSRVRTVVRRKERFGVSVRWTNSLDDLEIFHAMHVDLRKSKYRLLAQPFDLFANLREVFDDSMALVLAEIDGEPVAGMVMIEAGDTWTYKYGASYPTAYGPNAALLVEACQEGIRRGLDVLDLGRSDLSQPGLVRFKQQFSSEERPLATLRWSPDVPVPRSVVDANRSLTALTETLTDPGVPNHVAAGAGSILYQYFG